jgi:hypothetical protein
MGALLRAGDIVQGGLGRSMRKRRPPSSATIAENVNRLARAERLLNAIG